MTPDTYELPPLPEAPKELVMKGAWGLAAAYATTYARQAVEAEREKLNERLQWTGGDGTHHEVSSDYAVQILRWVFDKYGDVPQVDAAIRNPA